MTSTIVKHSTRRHNRGQGMTEYIIIVSLIAISAIGVITLFGDNVKALYGMSIDAISGDTSVEKRTVNSKTALERKDGLKGAWKNNDPY